MNNYPDIDRNADFAVKHYLEYYQLGACGLEFKATGDPYLDAILKSIYQNGARDTGKLSTEDMYTFRIDTAGGSINGNINAADRKEAFIYSNLMAASYGGFVTKLAKSPVQLQESHSSSEIAVYMAQSKMEAYEAGSVNDEIRFLQLRAKFLSDIKGDKSIVEKALQDIELAYQTGRANREIRDQNNK